MTVWPLVLYTKIRQNLLFPTCSYQKPRVDYFVQSMRADRRSSGYSVQNTGISELGSSSYKYVKSQSGKVVRYSYRTIRQIRNSRRSLQRGQQRYSAPHPGSKNPTPFIVNESTAPLVSYNNGSDKYKEVDGYGTLAWTKKDSVWCFSSLCVCVCVCVCVWLGEWLFAHL